MPLRNTLLCRYWFPVNDLVGFGVTAYSREDAETLLTKSGLPEELGWKIIGVIENVDLSTLEEFRRHCDFGTPNWRGIWTPFTYLPRAKEYAKAALIK